MKWSTIAIVVLMVARGAAEAKGKTHEASIEAGGQPLLGPIVTFKPPEDIEEMPADERPEGNDIEWIGGYYDFDAGRNKFFWVSGIYCKPQSQRCWMAGHWIEVPGGWRRQRGRWVHLELTTITFLPPPPEPKVEEEEK